VASRRLRTSAEYVDWVERHCVVPEGRRELIGRPLKVAPFMREDFEAIFDNPAGTRRAILTRGRKTGKTIEAALIVLLHLCGPAARPNGQLYSTALSRDQAAVLFLLAAKIVRMSPTLSAAVHVKDSAKMLLFPGMGTSYRALSADASTAFGLSPSLIIHDELGQVKGPRSSLYEAMETATAAQDDPLSIIISTQAPTDADLLSVLIDDAAKGEDPRIVLRMHAADPELDPFSEAAIRAANPAFDLFMNRAEVLAMAEGARRMPAREAEYRNLVLNQRVEASNPFIFASVWAECGGPVVDDFRGKPVYAGLDLSSTSDLTALVMIAPHDGKWHVKPIFWLPADGLRERARQDRVEYDIWAETCSECALQKKHGCLHPEKALSKTPGRSIEYEYIAEYLRSLFDRLDMRQVGFDRWNFRHLRPWLEKAGFREQELSRFVEFGQGFQSMSPALRDLESNLLAGRIVHGNHPVLTMCAANAAVERNSATGDRKLSKGRSRGRIDGMVSLAMARAVAATEVLKPEPSYQLFFT
jgi:phage terminase large subunit-like protein